MEPLGCEAQLEGGRKRLSSVAQNQVPVTYEASEKPSRCHNLHYSFLAMIDATDLNRRPKTHPASYKLLFVRYLVMGQKSYYYNPVHLIVAQRPQSSNHLTGEISVCDTTILSTTCAHSTLWQERSQGTLLCYFFLVGKTIPHEVKKQLCFCDNSACLSNSNMENLILLFGCVNRLNGYGPSTPAQSQRHQRSHFLGGHQGPDLSSLWPGMDALPSRQAASCPRDSV